MEVEAAVRELLHEAGVAHLPMPMTATAITPSAGLNTPETYLDAERASGFAQPLKPGVHFYPGVINPPLGEFALHGTWRVGSESAAPVSSGAAIQAGFQAAHVYLVLTSSDNVPRRLRVLLDGRPIPAAYAGADVHRGLLTVTGQRLYALFSRPRVGPVRSLPCRRSLAQAVLNCRDRPTVQSIRQAAGPDARYITEQRNRAEVGLGAGPTGRSGVGRAIDQSSGCSRAYPLHSPPVHTLGDAPEL